jgi:hypothetical protein
MKQVTLTILSDPVKFECAVAADLDNNVWVHVMYNGTTLVIPLAVFTVVENYVYDFIGNEGGEEH